MTTSLGEIEIELWSKECPKACRNFVQLCLEQFFNGTIFHRVVPNFIAQGGDPTGKRKKKTFPCVFFISYLVVL